MPQCKLCRLTAQKLSKSHIIPRALYGATLRDERGAAHLLARSDSRRPQRSLIGIYDSTILCASCEASFGETDNYANDLLFRRKPQKLFSIDHVNVADFGAFDSQKLILFFITLLWRMNETDHEAFAKVKLGPHTETFRLACMAKEAEMLPQLDVIIRKFDEENTAVVFPTRQKINAVNFYRVCFSGYSCLVKLDGRPLSGNLQALSIRNQASFALPIVPYSSSPERRAAISSLYANPSFGREH